MTLVQFGDGKFLRGFLPSLLGCLINPADCRIVVVAPLRKKTSFDAAKVLQSYRLHILGDAKNAAILPMHRTSQTQKAVSRSETERSYTESGANYRYLESGVYELQPYTRSINPYTEYSLLLEMALDESLRYIVSNTTERGFALHPDDSDLSVQRIFRACPQSFPAKLAAMMIHRFLHAKKSVLDQQIEVLPTELIFQNGNRLQNIVLNICSGTAVPGLVDWVERKIVFRNTLVDRMVVENPEQSTPIRTITSEPYTLWAIEDADRAHSADVLSGFIRAKDITNCYERKIHMVNAGHLILLAMHRSYEVTTVYEAMHNAECRAHFTDIMQTEVLPYIHAPQCDAYFKLCVARFAQEGLHHRFAAIANNLFEKLSIRILPIILRYWEVHRRLPAALCETTVACLRMQYQLEEASSSGCTEDQYLTKQLSNLFTAQGRIYAAFKQAYQ